MRRPLLVSFVIAVIFCWTVSAVDDEGEAVLNRRKRASISNKAKLWLHLRDEDNNYVIPYVIKPFRGRTYTEVWIGIFNEFHSRTCIRFVPRDSSHGQTMFLTVTYFMEFGTNQGHRAAVNRPDGHWLQPQLNINLAYVEVGSDIDEEFRQTVLHELLHVLGFEHEYERHDADDYVLADLDVRKISDGTIDYMYMNRTWTPYDIYSASGYYFHTLKRTSRTRNGQKFGKGLSRLDILAINRAYKCRKMDKVYLGMACRTPPAVIGGIPDPVSLVRWRGGRMFRQYESVHAECYDGYEPLSIGTSTCRDGVFHPRILHCVKSECRDKILGCEFLAQDPNFCNRTRYLCAKTCGYCQAGVCWDRPVMRGFGTIDSPGTFSLLNDTTTATCLPGFQPVTPTVSTCTPSGHDVPEFQCVAERNNLLGEWDRGKFCQETPVVKHGQFYPKMKLYRVGTVIQLVCDEGYEVASMSNTAKCYTLTSESENRAVFNYGKLACVKRRCKDRAPSFCERSTWRGCLTPSLFTKMERSCSRTCGHCSACKHSPLFDRRVSSLSPIKHEYFAGETVNVNCFRGYRPADNIRRSVCLWNTFSRSQLLCVPDESSCSHDNLVAQLGGRATVSPDLDIYPDGFRVNVTCSFPNDETNAETTEVVCLNGRFDLRGLVCPARSGCDRSFLFHHFVDTAGTNYSEICEVVPGWKEVYEEGEHAAVVCEVFPPFIKVVFRCEGNDFVVDKHGPRPCSTNWVFFVMEGCETPMQSVFAHGESVRTHCSKLQSSRRYVCNDTLFDFIEEIPDPPTANATSAPDDPLLLTFADLDFGNPVEDPLGCARLETNNSSSSSNSSDGSGADSRVCSRAALPLTYKKGNFEPLKEWYGEGESVVWACPKDDVYYVDLTPRTAFCQADGTFDRKRLMPCKDVLWQPCVKSDHGEIGSGRAVVAAEDDHEFFVPGEQFQVECLYSNRTYPDSCGLPHGQFEIQGFYNQGPLCPESPDYCVDSSVNCLKIHKSACKFEFMADEYCRKTCQSRCEEWDGVSVWL